MHFEFSEALMDPISDMLTRIRNAKAVGHATVSVPHSQMKLAILKILKRDGLIEEYEKKGKKVRKSILVTLRYHKDGSPYINDLKKVSKPGQRIYKKSSEIFPVKQGYGLAIVSTTSGLLTDKEARKKKLGGEVICEIW